MALANVELYEKKKQTTVTEMAATKDVKTRTDSENSLSKSLIYADTPLASHGKQLRGKWLPNH